MQIFSCLSEIYLGSLSLSSILSAILIFIVCLIVIKIVSKIVGKALERSKLEKGLRSFVSSAVKIVLWAVVIIIVAGSLGIDTASLVALLSVAGLALSLAVQDIASNLFSGITILATKPFVSGEYVSVNGVEGSVESIGLFHTTLLTGDQKIIYVPNKEVTDNKIINFSHAPLRRVDISLGVSYDAPIERVKAALIELMDADERILRDPAPFVGVRAYQASNIEYTLRAYQASNIEYTLRAWVKNSDYWDVFYALNEAALPALTKHGCSMSYDHVNVHIVEK